MTGTALDDRGVDPTFAETVELLTDGLVDPREAWDVVSKMTGPDGFSMHVPSPVGVIKPPTLTKQRRQKRQAQVGLASNVVGIAAGGAGLAAAGRDERLRAGGRLARGIYDTAKKVPEISPKAGKLGAAAAVGAVGLQAGNLVGDAVANRVLNREAKKKVAKALDPVVEQVLAARRAGTITTAQAIDIIEKGLLPGAVKDAVSLGRKGYQAARKGDDAVGAVTGGLKKLKQDRAYKTYTGNVIAGAAPKADKRVVAAAGVAGAAGAGIATHQVDTHGMTRVRKSADTVWTGTISKVNEEKRQVFGWCSVSKFNGEDVLDRQSDIFPLDEVEASAYHYVLNSRKGGDMHRRVKKYLLDEDEPLHTADLIESFVVTPEKLVAMGLDPDAVPHGWWVGFKVNDDKQWEDVKTGRRTGFSVHGRGSRVEKVLEG